MIFKQYFPQNSSQAEIIEIIRKEGFEPQLITDKPGFIYGTHTHAETKYIACIEGSMKVTINGKCYNFEPGDKIIIGASIPHSGVVGDKGCKYLWSEKVI